MKLTIQCPQCQVLLRAIEDVLGRRVKCQSCNTSFIVSDYYLPSSPSSPPPVPPTTKLSVSNADLTKEADTFLQSKELQDWLNLASRPMDDFQDPVIHQIDFQEWGVSIYGLVLVQIDDFGADDLPNWTIVIDEVWNAPYLIPGPSFKGIRRARIGDFPAFALFWTRVGVLEKKALICDDLALRSCAQLAMDVAKSLWFRVV